MESFNSGDVSLIGLGWSVIVWLNARLREANKRNDRLASKIADSIDEMTIFMQALSERAGSNAAGAEKGRELAAQRHDAQMAQLSECRAILSEVRGMLAGGRP